MSDNLAEVKARLRLQILNDRSTQLAEQTSVDFGLQMLKLCKQLSAKSVGIYLSFGSEPATDYFVANSKAAGLTLAAPRTGDDSSMEFGLLEGPTEKSSLGFLQPIGEVIEVDQMDLIIAPALAVDHLGNRLGRGAGFFDRYLKNFLGPVAAVIYPTEFVESLPAESHDRPVQYAITHSQIHPIIKAR